MCNEVGQIVDGNRRVSNVVVGQIVDGSRRVSNEMGHIIMAGDE